MARERCLRTLIQRLIECTGRVPDGKRPIEGIDIGAPILMVATPDEPIVYKHETWLPPPSPPKKEEPIKPVNPHIEDVISALINLGSPKIKARQAVMAVVQPEWDFNVLFRAAMEKLKTL